MNPEVGLQGLMQFIGPGEFQSDMRLGLRPSEDDQPAAFNLDEVAVDCEIGEVLAAYGAEGQAGR